MKAPETTASRRLRAGISAARVKLPESAVRAGTTAAAAFNVVGMLFELVLVRHAPTVPRWPELFSISAGCVILALLLLGKLDGRPRLQKALFVANAACVSLALVVIDSHLALLAGKWTFFQASKLGALVAGMLAPGFLTGVAAIGIHAGSTTARFLLFPPDVQARLGFGEPWPTLAFGLGGIFILMHRLRVRCLEQQAARALAEAEATRRIAETYLALRDLMNTPLQSVEIAAALLARPDCDRDAVLPLLQKSCGSLRELSQALKRHEHALEWKEGRGGLGNREK